MSGAVAIWLRYDKERSQAKLTAVVNGKMLPSVTFYEDDETELSNEVISLPERLAVLLGG